MKQPHNKNSELFSFYFPSDDHINRDYFALIRELIKLGNQHQPKSQAHMYTQKKIDEVYDQIRDEILSNTGQPVNKVKFGTSGWRGIIGKDLFAKSIQQVTQAIIDMYKEAGTSESLATELGIKNLQEAQHRGAVLGFDNRFGNDLMANVICDMLTGNGFNVHYAGEATTGTLSAAVVELKAAFSINLTPSHNPMDYGGFKFNAADGGPASATITNLITDKANNLINNNTLMKISPHNDLKQPYDAMTAWQTLVRKGKARHGLDYDGIIERFNSSDELAIVIDCVHGASKTSIKAFFQGSNSPHLQFLRNSSDPTFGGISPEPSPANLEQANSILAHRPEPLKLGVIMDPDADRIRLTDGKTDIDMNRFGAMAFHFLHEIKERKGIVAKTVATSNFANAMASAFHEKIFEPKVGFKEFKPVIDDALVCFEESDGITIIGHTPEKDAYIGLLLAIDMIMTLKKNLGDYLIDLQEEYGYYFPAKDGVLVNQKGDSLNKTLDKLNFYQVGGSLIVNGAKRTIGQVISIDGHKIILEDGSWLMIRPSGTEPKVRFYVEGRNTADTKALFACARTLLKDIGL